jgi:adenylate cyclase
MIGLRPFNMKVSSGNTFTFLFSDIEGSTKLACQLENDYPSVLEQHRKVIREAMQENLGLEVDTAGDSFFIVFPLPIQAIRTAVSVQQTFARTEWAVKVGLQVRIGLHTGEGLATETGFTGLEVHRASRICNAGHGGQVLLSSATLEALSDTALPEGVTTRKLGSFRLKDFDDPENLFQLIIPDIQTEFPPPKLASSKPKIAVLPFENLSADPQQEYFCDGIAEEIRLALDRVPGIRVVARSSSFALKGKNLDAREMGKRLQASAILEGTVRQQNGNLRIGVQLVDSRSGLNIWSNRFDRKLEDLFAVQDEIAHNIANRLEVELLPVKRDVVQERQTSNFQAYDYYLKGQEHYHQFSQKSVELALEMFQKAIDLDKNYALAYSGQANCFAYLYLYMECSEENLQQADYSSRLAVELDPNLAEAYASRGVTLTLLNQFKEAEQAFEKSLTLNPHLFEAWYQFARSCYAQGKMDKAARLFEEASKVRPEDYQAILLAGQVYAALGIDELASKARQKGIKIARKHLRNNPEDSRAMYMSANGLVGLGKHAQAMDLLKRALSLDSDDPMLLYNAACVFAQMGMKKKAMDCLENSYAAGLTQLGWIKNDSDLDVLRDHPRFQALLAQMN